jgi:UDP-sugar transporter A1/2/3
MCYFYIFLIAFSSLVNAIAGIAQVLLFTIFIYIEEGSLVALKHSFKTHIFADLRMTFRMALPPIFLILSNELLLVSSNILPLKSESALNYTIIGVAFCSVLVLKKKLFLTQALAIYFVARGLDHFPQDSLMMNVKVDDSTSSFFGHFAIALAILCYGMSYVILEKILKSSDVSLWIRGIQLNLFTVPLSLFLSFTNDWMNQDDPRGFFDNFNIIAWFFIFFKIAQQMMELFVIKVADSIYRSFALSTALVIIGGIKFMMEATDTIKLGTGLVMAGITLYTIMDHFPRWNDFDSEFEFPNELRESPISCNETLSKGYQTVPTVSSKISNIDVYLKLIDEPTREA